MAMRKVSYPAQFQYLEDIRDFVSGIAREGGFNEKEIYSIQLAADEAASNIIEHAYAGVTDGELELACGMKDDLLTITLLDYGKPFDPDSVRPPDLKARLFERQIGGLGIYLMRKLMDEVRYESSAEAGNRLTLTKRRHELG
jgi:serine/threonine-protein kinase RsbW